MRNAAKPESFQQAQTPDPHQPATRNLEPEVASTREKSLAPEERNDLPPQPGEEIVDRWRAEPVHPHDKRNVELFARVAGQQQAGTVAAGPDTTDSEDDAMPVPRPPRPKKQSLSVWARREERHNVSAFRAKKAAGMLRTLNLLPRDLFEEAVRRLGYGQKPLPLARYLLSHSEATAVHHLSVNSLRQYLQVLDAKLRDHDQNRGARLRSIREQAKQLREERRQESPCQEPQDLAEIEAIIVEQVATLDLNLAFRTAWFTGLKLGKQLDKREEQSGKLDPEYTKMMREMIRLADAATRDKAVRLRSMAAERKSRQEYRSATLTQSGNKLHELVASIHVNAAGCLPGDSEWKARALREIITASEEAETLIAPLRSA